MMQIIEIYVALCEGFTFVLITTLMKGWADNSYHPFTNKAIMLVSDTIFLGYQPQNILLGRTTVLLGLYRSVS